MKSKMKKVTESLMISEVMEACSRASERGTSEQEVSEALLLATVIRLFLYVGEDGTGALLRHALRDIENGDFALMLEKAGFIERVPMT